MTPLLLIATAVAGGIGGALRFAADAGVRRIARGPFPWGTSVVNVTGSFALGLVTGLAAGVPALDGLATLVGTGLLGGYTTFSTASVETVRLAQQRRWVMAALNALANLVLCVVAAVLGLWLGSTG